MLKKLVGVKVKKRRVVKKYQMIDSSDKIVIEEGVICYQHFLIMPFCIR